MPSMREKKRYLVYEISSTASPSTTAIATSLKQAMLQYTGELGVANMGPVILAESYNAKTKRGIIRVAADCLDLLKASLVFVTTIDGAPASVRSLVVSGAIGTAKQSLSK